MSILTLKEEYNNLLIREAKAEIYLDDNSKSITDRELWVPEYQKVINRLGEIIEELGTNGVIITKDQILGGFNLEGDEEQC